MADAVQEKAYGAITIADIVRAAGVSKRSFYEHFESKKACFLALYAAASRIGLAHTARPSTPISPGNTKSSAVCMPTLNTWPLAPACALRCSLTSIFGRGRGASPPLGDARARRFYVGNRQRSPKPEPSATVPKTHPHHGAGHGGVDQRAGAQRRQRGAAADLPSLTADAVSVVRLLSQV